MEDEGITYSYMMTVPSHPFNGAEFRGTFTIKESEPKEDGSLDIEGEEAHIMNPQSISSGFSSRGIVTVKFTEDDQFVSVISPL